MKKVVLSLVAVVVIIGGCWLNAPMSDVKALERVKMNIQNGAYCSGYHNNNADGTRIVVFRDVKTNKVVDEFEVSWSLGEKIYNEEV